MLLRRLATVPAFLSATVLAGALVPLLLPFAALAGLAPRHRGAPATMLFMLGYLWCETLGILAAGYLYLRHRDPRRFRQANYRLQCWWCNALKVLAERLFRLEFQVAGADSLDGPPALMLPRHASIADTIIPMVFYAIPRRIRLRYVLKRELLLDPCLDIVGNRLRNFFVDRGGQDSAGARRGVAELVSDLESDEGLLLYPEGTRFSAARHRALLERHGREPQMRAQLERWPDLLPPRRGGFLALLAANPGRDLVFCAHAGFEGASHFANLWRGGWLGARIGIRFWRVPFAEIPADEGGRLRLLGEAWDRMQDEVALLTREVSAPSARPSGQQRPSS